MIGSFLTQNEPKIKAKGILREKTLDFPREEIRAQCLPSPPTGGPLGLPNVFLNKMPFAFIFGLGSFCVRNNFNLMLILYYTKVKMR